MRKLRRSHIYILVFLVVGFLVYWVVSWYIPMPPITSEKEATTAVMYYLRDYPELNASLSDRETSTYNEGERWMVTIYLDNKRRPSFVAFEVNKITGYVKPIPVR